MTSRFSEKARFRLAADAWYANANGECECRDSQLVAYSQGHSLPWNDPERTSAFLGRQFVETHPVWFHRTSVR